VHQWSISSSCCHFLVDENVAGYLLGGNFRDGHVQVQTAMWDNCQGWGNFSRDAFGIDSNVCKEHATVMHFIHCSLSPPPADSVTGRHSCIIPQCGCQHLLVDYLRTKHSDDVANWCRDFWTDARGRMCLTHGRYGGCNNNMVVEVSWREIKTLCYCIASESLG
jgi:hypothetical protein